MKKLLLLYFITAFYSGYSQIPLFSNEIPVTINGYSLDAMEAFLSPDGNAMFFNSLNDGNTTSLYYVAKVNDSTFNYVGPVPIVNQTVTPRLDGVPSLDTADNFYWVSTRGYPSNFDNLHRIRFLQSGFTNFGRVHGTIYIYSPGWIIMDAAVNYSGDEMYYCNAKFNGCAFNLPCRSAIGVANKINDSTFNKSPNSTFLFSNINDTLNYVVYAPQLSKDGLELYFSRALHNNAQTEICVSVRTNTSAAFGLPSVIYPLSSLLPEAATVSTDKSKIYYHRQVSGIFKLFLKKRTGTTSLTEIDMTQIVSFFPNPNYGILTIESPTEILTEIFDLNSRKILSSSSKTIDISHFQAGGYLIRFSTKDHASSQKLIVLPH